MSSMTAVNKCFSFAQKHVNNLMDPFEKLVRSTKNSFTSEKPFGKWKQTTDEKRLSYVFQESLLLGGKVVLVGGAAYALSLTLTLAKVTVVMFVGGACLYKLSQKHEAMEKAANRCKELWRSVNDNKVSSSSSSSSSSSNNVSSSSETFEMRVPVMEAPDGSASLVDVLNNI